MDRDLGGFLNSLMMCLIERMADLGMHRATYGTIANKHGTEQQAIRVLNGLTHTHLILGLSTCGLVNI